MAVSLLVHNHFGNSLVWLNAPGKAFYSIYPRKIEGRFFLSPNGTFAALSFFLSLILFFFTSFFLPPPHSSSSSSSFTFTIYPQSFYPKRENSWWLCSLGVRFKIIPLHSPILLAMRLFLETSHHLNRTNNISKTRFSPLFRLSGLFWLVAVKMAACPFEVCASLRSVDVYYEQRKIKQIFWSVWCKSGCWHIFNLSTCSTLNPPAVAHY